MVGAILLGEVCEVLSINAFGNNAGQINNTFMIYRLNQVEN